MCSRPRRPSKAVLYLSKEIATLFCQKLAKASNAKALTDDELFNQALEHMLEEVWSIRAARKQEIADMEAQVQGQAALAALQQVVPSQPAAPMDTREVLKALNLVHEAQIQVACSLGWLRPVARTQELSRSKQAMYLILVAYPLTPTQRQELEKLTLLNQQQCADFLKVAYYRFIQLRDQYKLKAEQSNNPLSTGNARFYRLHDLMKILPRLG